jgi:hypothetical protein
VSFVARRLPRNAVLLCTARTEDGVSRLQLPSPDAVRRIRLQPLTVGELHQVLTLRLGGLVPRPTLLRIHEAALATRILVSLSFALINAGQPEQAYDHVQRAVAEAERLGVASLLSPALGMRAMLDFMSGRGFDKPAMRRAVELQEPDPRVPVAFRPNAQLTLLRAWTGELIFVAFHLALIDIWRGDLKRAAITADDTMERASQLGGDFPLFTALTIRATVAAYVGGIDDARRDLGDAIAAARRCGSLRLAEWPSTIRGFVEVPDVSHRQRRRRR